MGSLRSRRRDAGSTMVLMVIAITVVALGGLAFLSRSVDFLTITQFHTDSVDANYQMETAYDAAKSKVERAVTGVILNGRLQHAGGPTGEDFFSLATAYVGSTIDPLDFLKEAVKAQAYSVGGTLDSTHEFAGEWTDVFPSTWTDPDLSDDQYFEFKYSFSPLDATQTASPQAITFEYEYRVQVRGYGQSRYANRTAEASGTIEIVISGAPFSQWGVFMNTMKNQLGQTLVFAGGNTSSQVQEVYGGPVHVNGTPYFYGHPIFQDYFTSAVAETSWVKYSTSTYTGPPVWDGGKAGGVASISMPTQIFNTLRLAAGDTSNTAATNNTTVTNSELRGFLSDYDGGTLAVNASPVPTGVYIPIDSAGNPVPTGGVYVEGDARITLDVVQGSSDFSSAQWAEIDTDHQSCKFQKVRIASTTSGVAAKDIYIGDDPCEGTYVFTDSVTTPTYLEGRLNGNIHVNGKVDELGGASRTRPAIAEDFGITVSAVKDVRIINDIQYEDAKYVYQNSDGTVGTDYVADPEGELDGSGILPTNANVKATIDDDSQTVLGIISTQRNIMLHSSAPANINLHAALFAGNSAAYDSSTGLGCGSSGANTQGCGFGYESYTTATGMGNLKFFGAMSEYKDQTTGVLSSPPKGYGSRIYYDTRLRQDLTPPAFPVSDSPQAYGTVKPYRTWRLNRAGL